MHAPALVSLLTILTLALACSGPSLDVPSRPQDQATLELAPAREAGVAAPSFRARLHQAPAAGEPWLFRGELSSYYEHALGRGDLPEALRERAVPLRFWRDAADCWLQPLTWLEPDETYTLGWSGRGALGSFEVQAGSEPRASRLFPPAGSAKHRVAVVCDMNEDAPLTALSLSLEPGAVPLRAVPGVGGVARPGCVTLIAERDVSELAVSSPLVAGALVEPSGWLPATGGDVAAPACPGALHAGGCLELEDDRLLVTPQSSDQLWLLEMPLAAAVPVAAGRRTTLLSDLAPETGIALSASVLSSDGALEHVTFEASTRAARRHLVLNEVLANPLGDEASGEWIELLNDSRQPSSLAGLWLEDASGRVALPDAVLAPGELVLLVARGFHPSTLDVAVPASVRSLELPSLGTRGLANGGEALLLAGPEGVLSRFPQLPANHAGRSVARRSPEVADDDPQGFGEHGAPGASPGALNRFDPPSDEEEP